jgi:CheY-like chemotaxis protein
MEAIGKLAGGVAHDFNNLLTVISGNASLLQAALPAEDQGRELVRSIDVAATRAAELVRQLLGFSRRTLLWLKPTDLRTCLAEIHAILCRTIDPRIQIEVKCVGDPWPVQADPGQMNQVLMNLCLNARDAMPEGGRLTLELENVTIEKDDPSHPEGRSGDFVRLQINDTGQGITPEIQSHIFEPFFTTKGPGKGTGLGLAMVFGIIQQHQGWIECASTLGQGTRFSIYLPRLRGQVETAPAVEAPTPAAGGTETILLVDDEPFVREVARRILVQRGYRVIEAADGLHALEAYRKRTPPFDLVILDLIMPKLSGRDTFRELRKLDPNARVMFASGYSAESVADPSTEGALGFLGKPYREQELVRLIRQVLDRGQSPPGQRGQ